MAAYSELHERIGRLEERLDHLDDCVDGVKVMLNEKHQENTARMNLWEKRGGWGIAFLLGMMLATGGGTISLKTLIEWIAK